MYIQKYYNEIGRFCCTVVYIINQWITPILK